MLSKWGILPKIALPWLWPLCVLCGKTLLCGRSDVQHWQKISFHFFSYDTQHIWQDTHQVWRGKQLKCPLANEKFCQIMCHPDTLEIFCSYFMFRVNIPGVDHYWNKDPSKVVFLFQLWPCSVGVAPSKAYPNFKKQGRPFCKMKWHAHHTVIWRVFRFKKCSSRYNVPSKTALSTCSNMFQFLQSWYFLLMPLGTLIIKIADHKSQMVNPKYTHSDSQ